MSQPHLLVPRHAGPVFRVIQGGLSEHGAPLHEGRAALLHPNLPLANVTTPCESMLPDEPVGPVLRVTPACERTQWERFSFLRSTHTSREVPLGGPVHSRVGLPAHQMCMFTTPSSKPAAQDVLLADAGPSSPRGDHRASPPHHGTNPGLVGWIGRVLRVVGILPYQGP